jgi:hypothetical protein
MFASDPPVRSLDRLAAECLNSDRWPESGRMQPRSLGAIFGKLDRDENLEWLASRPEVQSALAEVLRADPEAIQSALQPDGGRRPGRWLSWEAMPYARGLDLLEEELFPGLPEELLRPGGWRRLIWMGPNGSGRSLVGSWLEARGLARHVVLPELRREAWVPELARAPGSLPVLLELGSTEGLDLEALGSGVCVAVPDPAVLRESSDWKVVHSPPVSELVEPLASWACERLSANSRVDRKAMLEMLEDAAKRGVVRSAGDVLGLVGLADAFGFNAFEFSALRALAREWFKRRVGERLDRDAPGTAWMRRDGFDALVALCRRVATDARESLFFARSLEAWSALLPAELRQGADLDWLKVALPRADPNVRVADLERASEKLPPGAFRLLRAFERIGVLVRDGSDRLVLRPHWLVRAAFEDALEGLVTGPAFDWGEALLSPSMAGVTAVRILARARAGEILHEELVDPDAIGDPAYAAATEGAVRAIGVSVLLGAPAPSESLEALWDEQLRLVVELPGELPLPRIDAPGFPKRERGAWFFDRGIWYLSVLALSELLAAHEGRAHATLRPWQTTGPSAELSAVLDRLVVALERRETPRELVGPALSLVGRLRALLGPLGPGGAPHPLERAAMVAAEAKLGVLSWEALVTLRGDELSLAALSTLCRERKMDEAAFAGALWDAFLAAGMPLETADILLVPALAPALAHAPALALTRLVPLLSDAKAPLPLADEQWRVLLGGGPRRVPRGLFRQVPLSMLDGALRAAPESPGAFAELWQRFSGQLEGRILAALAANDPDPVIPPLLEHAPASFAPVLVRALDEVDDVLRAPAATLGALRRFLHARVAERAVGFRDTYALLDEIERRCAPLRESSLY